MRDMPQKTFCTDDGLQETNGRANTDTRCRAVVFDSSNIDRHYGGNPDLKNNLGKAETIRN